MPPIEPLSPALKSPYGNRNSLSHVILTELATKSGKPSESAMRTRMNVGLKPSKTSRQQVNILTTSLTNDPTYALELSRAASTVLPRSTIYASKKKAEAEIPNLERLFTNALAKSGSAIKNCILDFPPPAHDEPEAFTAYRQAVTNLEAAHEHSLGCFTASTDFLQVSDDHLARALEQFGDAKNAVHQAARELGDTSGLTGREQSVRLHLFDRVSQKLGAMETSADEAESVLKRFRSMYRSHKVLQRLGHITRHPSWAWYRTIMPKTLEQKVNNVMQLFGLVTLILSAPLMYVSFKQMFESSQPQDQGGMPPTEAPPGNYSSGAQASSTSLAV